MWYRDQEVGETWPPGRAIEARGGWEEEARFFLGAGGAKFFLGAGG
eukprot:CAMPEP_0195102324 /NCGR_PEP_ID=MMETSP0448-20130528/67123_1 /TAXON_ID=66468 /ORGANISM="Heterocapsa triquestra, Strain CCMP 448" /LENGTH=45 /DNA_ID= /DNA_START= /DNA_END= /DNA_ORIENTATION=